MDTSALCATTPSGLTAGGDNMLGGLKLSSGETFPVFGSTAADLYRFEGTYQYCHESVFIDSLPFLLISGRLLYSFDVATGRIPIGFAQLTLTA